MTTKKIQQPILLQEWQFFDKRGKFLPSKLNNGWIQQNVSTNSRGTLRGMHFQIGNFAQAKLVRVLSGSVIDVVIDLRNIPENKNYLDVKAYHLTHYENAHNHPTLFVPKGFAHGFLTLEDNTIFEYKIDTQYSKENERSIHYKSFVIFEELFKKYNISQTELNISNKDLEAPTLQEWIAINEDVLPKNF